MNLKIEILCFQVIQIYRNHLLKMILNKSKSKIIYRRGVL
jgi:hypothetical protein